MSIPPPNYTQTPNVIYDLMPEMKEAELRITLAIVRETFGWHRETARLSITKLQKLTGLSRQGVINGTEAGIGRGTITREKEGDGYLYSLHVNEVDTQEQLVNVVDYPSQRSRLALVNVVDQQTPVFPEVAAPPKESIKKTSIKEKVLVVATPQPTPPPPKKKRPRNKTPSHPNTTPIIAAFTVAKETVEPGCVVYPAAEGKAAKDLAEKGWTTEQVIECFNLLKADAWWQDKSLHLSTIASQIGAKLKGKLYAEDRPDRWTPPPDPALAAMSEQEFLTSLNRDFGTNYGVQ